MRGKLFGLIAGAVFAFPAYASAGTSITFCVNDQACVDQGGIAKASLTTALSDAASAPGFQVIEVGTGTYTDGPWSYGPSADGGIQVLGEGMGQTILTAPDIPSSQSAFTLTQPNSSIGDLTIAFPTGAPSLNDGALQLGNDATAGAVEITAPAEATTAVGVSTVAGGGTFINGKIDLDAAAAPQTIGAFALSGRVVVEGTTVDATVGVMTDAPSTENNVAFSKIRLATGGVSGEGIAAFRGDIDVHDTLIHIPGGSNRTAINAHNETTGQANVTIDARHVTVAAASAPSSTGVRVSAEQGGGGDATVELRNSIVSGASTPLHVSADAGNTATLTTSFSNYPSTGNIVDDGATGTASIDATDALLDVAPGFVDAAGGDFHLAPTSELIDAGDPAPDSNVDLDGNPRAADGDGDGVARRDVGAYELPDTFAPDAVITKSPKRTHDRTPKFKFEAAVNEETLHFECKVDSKPFEDCSSPFTTKRLKPGRHKFSVTVSDALDNEDPTPAKARFRVLG